MDPSQPGLRIQPALPGPRTQPALPGPRTQPALPGPRTQSAQPGPRTQPAQPGPRTQPGQPGPRTRPRSGPSSGDRPVAEGAAGKAGAVPVVSADARRVIPGQRTPRRRDVDVAVRATADQSTPDEPTAVLVVGEHDSGKRDLVRALLAASSGAAGDRMPWPTAISIGSGVVDVPAATYLVIKHGTPGPATVHVPGAARGYLPATTPGYAPGQIPAVVSVVSGEIPGAGYPEIPGAGYPEISGAGYPEVPGAGSDHFAGAGGGAGDRPEPERPPRRVEISLPDPLLRHFALVQAPCSERLGVAGALVLADAAERGGAVVFVATAAHPLSRAELDLLGELSSREISVFFAVVSGGGDDEDPGEAFRAHQAAVARQVPELSGAPWFPVDPDAGDVAFLRRALVEWAGAEALRRAGGNPPMPAGTGTVHVDERAARSGWPEALDRWLRGSTRLVRQRLAIEVAGIHLRCVQDIIFGGGCARLAETLDNELHALSLRATAESDTAVAAVVHELLRRVLDTEPAEEVRRRVSAAVRRGLASDVGGRDLARVLLVTAAGEVEVVAGGEALAALPGYATQTVSPILPPVGLAVSAGCYTLWREQAGAEVGKARSWLQLVTRAVELELLRDVGRRFQAVHRSLGGLVAETVDHGILLA